MALSKHYSGPPSLLPAHLLRAPDAFVKYVIEGGHAGVHGWVLPGALSAVSLLSSIQTQLGVEGHVCEIGVHHGRYMIALSSLRKPGERSLAIDVFDLQEFNVDNSGLGDLKTFNGHVESWLGRDAHMIVHKSDSLKISGRDVKALLDGPVRLFSVDGSHTAGHTLNDIRVAEESLAEGGVVVVDDFLNPAWPGVVEGIFQYLSQPEEARRLAPIGYGDNKFYFTTKGYDGAYRDAIRKLLPDTAKAVKRVTLCGADALFFSLPEPAMVFAATRAEPGGKIQFVAGREAKVAPLIGQRQRFEGAGAWAVHVWSGAAIDLPADRRNYTVSVRLSCFRHAKDPVPKVGVYVLGQHVADAEFPAGSDQRVVTFAADRKSLGLSDRLEIWLHNPRATSPKEAGVSGDPRRLCCLVQDVSVTPAD